MKKEKITILIFLLVFLIVGLNTRFSSVPPLGKLLSPFTGYLQNNGEHSGVKEFDLDLTSEASIFVDGRSVPHIMAGSEDDLYYLQGYFHAKDRLFQMDIMTRFASGRLSELLGETTVERDKVNRRKGLLISARRSLEFIEKNFPDTYRHFLNYSKGVNEYISRLGERDFPVEYKLLNCAPEDWNPVKTVLMQKYMADLMTGTESDLENNNALSFFGTDMFGRLYESDLKYKSVMVSGADTSDAGRINNLSSLKEQNAGLSYVTGKSTFESRPAYGSNSWVISGKKSKTGYPILANDPHLPLTLPSIWYEMQLCTNKSNVYGASIPGVPYIIIGYNEHIAWGITSGQTDVKDWYALKFRNNDEEYFFKGKWRKTIKKPEYIPVYGSFAEEDTVVYTAIGPTIVFNQWYGSNPGSSRLALKWAGNEVSNDFRAFYLLNNSVDYDGYSKAIQHLVCPNINVSFASKKDIGISHQGLLPLREPNMGRFVIDGDKPKNSVYRYIPREELPCELNPSDGYLCSANQCPTGENYRYWLYGYYAYYRNRVIDSVLYSMNNVDLTATKQLQLNNFDLFAHEALNTMLVTMNRKELTKTENNCFEMLKSWNRYDERQSSCPVLFYKWWELFYKETWDELYNNKTPILSPDQDVMVKMIKTDSHNRYFDVSSTPEIESAADVLLSSFKKCVMWFNERDKQKKLRWGNYKSTIFHHIIRIPAFSEQNVDCDGSSNSVNATGTDYGPGWRMIVMFNETGPEGYGINPGGQSGNPGSKFYNSGLDAWVKGEYYKLLFMKRTDFSDKKYNVIVVK